MSLLWQWRPRLTGWLPGVMGLVPALPIPPADAAAAAVAAPAAGVLDALPPPAGPCAAEVFILLSYV